MPIHHTSHITTAAGHGHKEVVMLLVNGKADVNLVDEIGWSALGMFYI